MLILPRNWGILKEKFTFFSTGKETQRLVAELSWNEIARIQYTPVDISRHNRMVHKEVSRTWCIDLTKDLEQIFREMKKITRREIRRAEDMLSDIEVRVNDETAQKDFFVVYNNFVKEKKHTHRLSLSRYKDYSKVGDVFVLYFKGQPYSASLDIADYSTKRAYGVFLGSNRLNNEADAKFSSYLNRYLYWYEIQTYKNKKFEIYDFGGVGLMGTRTWFKQSFGGSALEEYHYIFAGSNLTYLLSKAAMKSLKLVSRIRSLSNYSLK